MRFCLNVACLFDNSITISCSNLRIIQCLQYNIKLLKQMIHILPDTEGTSPVSGHLFNIDTSVTPPPRLSDRFCTRRVSDRCVNITSDNDMKC